MINQKGNTVAIVLGILGVLVVGYIVFTKAVLPSLINKVVDTAVESSIDSLNFENAQILEINETVKSVDSILDLETLNKGVININGKSPNNQITGNIKYLGLKPLVEYKITEDPQVEGPFGAFTVKSQDQTGEERTLHFPTNLETGFIIALGAGKANIDLSDLNTTYINIAAGAGVVNLTFSKTASTTAKLNAGAGALNINVYKGTGVKLIFAQAFGNANFGEAYEKVANNTYQTKNYDQADVQVNLEIGQAAGGFKIQEI